ncbi:MAG: XRE family transcriptional regulator [Crocosphaera sp.]|jgi:transcriptional regulator with XRE-family HTH domain
MNTLLENKSNRAMNTSAYGAMRHSETHPLISSRIFLASSTTSASITSCGQDWLRAALDLTSSGVNLPSTSSTEVTQKAIHEIRKVTGLTWEKLAKLFNVSRRTLHFWASGKRLNSFNEEQLNLLLDTIRYIDRGSASLNRNLLLMPLRDGTVPFNLLIAGQYKKVKNFLGSGNAPTKPKLNPLSEDAIKSRTPISPENLIDALQDPIEPIRREARRSRPAKSVRSRKNSSGK